MTLSQWRVVSLSHRRVVPLSHRRVVTMSQWRIIRLTSGRIVRLTRLRIRVRMVWIVSWLTRISTWKSVFSNFFAITLVKREIPDGVYPDWTLVALVLALCSFTGADGFTAVLLPVGVLSGTFHPILFGVDPPMKDYKLVKNEFTLPTCAWSRFDLIQSLNSEMRVCAWEWNYLDSFGDSSETFEKCEDAVSTSSATRSPNRQNFRFFVCSICHLLCPLFKQPKKIITQCMVFYHQNS